MHSQLFLQMLPSFGTVHDQKLNMVLQSHTKHVGMEPNIFHTFQALKRT